MEYICYSSQVLSESKTVYISSYFYLFFFLPFYFIFFFFKNIYFLPHFILKREFSFIYLFMYFYLVFSVLCKFRFRIGWVRSAISNFLAPLHTKLAAADAAASSSSPLDRPPTIFSVAFNFCVISLRNVEQTEPYDM